MFGNDTMKTVAFIETRSLLPKSCRVKLCQHSPSKCHTHKPLNTTRAEVLKRGQPHHTPRKKKEPLNHWSNSIDVRWCLCNVILYVVQKVRTSPYFRVSGASRWNNDPALYTNILYIYIISLFPNDVNVCVCVCFHLLLFLQKCVIQFQHSSYF